MDYAEKTQRCQYVEALEEERRKIQVFQRELPLCLDLVTQTIEACKRELSSTTTEHVQGHSDCSEQTSSDAPVLEEFIPIKRSGYGEAQDDEDEDDRSSNKRSKNVKSGSASTISNNTAKDANKDRDHKRKSDWLRSVQLWNQSPDPSPPTHKEEVPRKAVVTEVKRNGMGGAFQPFQRDKGKTWSSDGRKNSNGGGAASSDKATAPSCSAAVPASATSSSAETVGSRGGTSRKEDKDSVEGGTSLKEDKDAGGQRKQRRCWSPELHRRFLHALQQLGGSHAATPKQIRELMKVDGLTNDEVKSHLQKYRLHTRRPSPTIHNSSNPQAPQFVVVGGIWVPPPEFTPVAATTGSAETAAAAISNGIYTPVATKSPSLLPPQSVVTQKAEQQRVPVSEGRESDSEGDHELCNSPATSSSTHTTTTSPVY